MNTGTQATASYMRLPPLLALSLCLLAVPARAQSPVAAPQAPRIPRDALIVRIAGIDIIETPMFVTADPNRLFANQVAKMRVRLDRPALIATPIALGVEYATPALGNVLIVPASVTVPAGAQAALFDATADLHALTLTSAAPATVLAAIGPTLGSAPARAPALRVFGGNPPAVPPICDVPTGLSLSASPANAREGETVTISVSSSCAPRGGGGVDLARQFPPGTTVTSEMSAALTSAGAAEPRNLSLAPYRTTGSRSYVVGPVSMDLARLFQAAVPFGLGGFSNAVSVTYRTGACSPTLSVSVSPGAIPPGGSATAVVTLGCAIGEALSVQLIGSSASLGFPQGTLVIPAGQTVGSGILVASPQTVRGSQIQVRAIPVNIPGIGPSPPVLLMVL